MDTVEIPEDVHTDDTIIVDGIEMVRPVRYQDGARRGKAMYGTAFYSVRPDHSEPCGCEDDPSDRWWHSGAAWISRYKTVAGYVISQEEREAASLRSSP